MTKKTKKFRKPLYLKLSELINISNYLIPKNSYATYEFLKSPSKIWLVAEDKKTGIVTIEHPFLDLTITLKPTMEW